MSPRRALGPTVLAFSAALLLAACGGPAPLAEATLSPTDPPATLPPTLATPTTAPTPTSTPTPAAQPTSAPTPMPTSAVSPAAASPSRATLEVARSTEHGEYLAVDGFALYTFTPDEPGTSTCYDACADNWPPLLAPVTAGPGVTGALGEFEREGGEGTQVTYNDAPLYFFVADTDPGQTSGESVGGVWFLARPSAAADPGDGPDY